MSQTGKEKCVVSGCVKHADLGEGIVLRQWYWVFIYPIFRTRVRFFVKPLPEYFGKGRIRGRICYTII